MLPPPSTSQHPLLPFESPPPPPHALQFTPADYTHGGMPLPQAMSSSPESPSANSTPSRPDTPGIGPGGRPLIQSKRAKQNRKAQRAFRERRQQYVIPLISSACSCPHYNHAARRVNTLQLRSDLLDVAVASADEANRRWEECKALVEEANRRWEECRAQVDQLRIENAALRAALGPAQLLND